MECQQCSKTFARPEHLRRHKASVHAQESYACEVCGKTFNRNDSCRRHEASAHGRKDDTNFIHSNGSRRRVRRACTHCAVARTKCSGGVCCSRCQKRNLKCQYMATSSARGRGDEAVTPSNDQEAGSTIIVASESGQTVMPEQFVEQATGNAAAWNANDLFVPDESMEYMWSDQTNWLPVADAFDMLGDLSTAAYPAVDAWNRSVPSVPPLESSLASPPSVSTSGVGSSIDSRRRADLSYASGQGARGSLQDAPRESDVASTEDDGDSRVILELDFPDMTGSLPINSQLDVSNAVQIDPVCYRTMLWHFETLCCHDSNFYTKYVSTRFPPIDYLSYCLNLYRETFQKHFAFVHCSALWYEQSEQWLLILAVVATGCGFDRSRHARQCQVAFTELLRRAIGHAFETGAHGDPLPFAQACLHLAVAKSSRSAASGTGANMNEVNAACDLYLQQYRMVAYNQFDASQRDLQWRAWVSEQSHVRLLWSKWLLQTLLSLFKSPDIAIGLPLEDLPLPCHDQLWEANTVEAWSALVDQTPNRMLSYGHRSALYQLYTRHKIQEKSGSVEKVILAYCVVSRTAEVARSLRHPLYAWSPAPAREVDEESDVEERHFFGAHESQQQQWLPANPVFAAWRNSACDCFDVLHWQANAETAVDKGLEAPIILHLHACRLFLLCPYETLTQMCERLSSRRLSSDATSQLLAGNVDSIVVKWLTLDDHKGRLSVIHAGAIYWHIRRYSCGMFYEPFCIFISTLVIVSYGIFLPQVHGALMRIKESTSQARVNTGSGGRSGGGDSDEEDYLPNSILVDRPCDDEMVQIFVRRGHKMRVEMSKAGDICLPQGQRVVLDEGIKLLRRSQYSAFDDSREYVRTLQKLKQRIL